MYFTDGVYFVVAVKKELNSRMEWWKEKQAEIENEFKLCRKLRTKCQKASRFTEAVPTMI